MAIQTVLGRQTLCSEYESDPAGRRLELVELEALRVRMVEQHKPANADPALACRIDRASRDATSLATLHEFPLLLFPTLFAEKLDEARRHAVLQRFVLHRSSPLTNQF